KNITKADLQAVAKSLQETMSRVTKTLDNKKKPYIHPVNENNHDPVDNISDSLAGLILNSVINTAIKHAIKKSSSGHKYFKCG
ncbi:552_t:CDS:2, partial [Dentiscutata heterogama]